MSTTTLDTASLETLKRLEGHTLDTCSGYLLFQNPNVFFGRVHLCFNGLNLNIVNSLQTVEIDEEESTETIGLLSIDFSEDPIWLPDGEKIYKEQYGLQINSVYVIEDTIRLMNGDNELSAPSFTQAVVLQTESGYVGFDKGVWFDEYITVALGEALEDVVRDCSKDWITDGTFWNEVSRKVIRL